MRAKTSRQSRFLTRDSWIILSLACLANAAIVVVAAMAFRNAQGTPAGLEEAYRELDPVFGAGAGVVFAVGYVRANLIKCGIHEGQRT